MEGNLAKQISKTEEVHLKGKTALEATKKRLTSEKLDVEEELSRFKVQTKTTLAFYRVNARCI